MKKFIKISWDIENPPGYLLASLGMAFTVMLLLNCFVGSMGGFPAFAAYGFMFYVLRGFVLSGSRISHQLAIGSRKEVSYILRNYTIGYLVIWGIIKVVTLLAAFAGWGRVDGLTITEYWNRLYGSSMLERWAYFVAGVFMFDFIISLFPLLVIKKKSLWIRYFAVDVLVYILVCGGIIGVCRIFTGDLRGNNPSNVLDNLLLCQLTSPWYGACYVIAAVLIGAGLLVFVYHFSVKCYRPKPGTIGNKENLMSEPKPLTRRRRILYTVAGVTLAVCIAVVCRVFFAKQDSGLNYYKVAECLTQDEMTGPMVYGGNVYIPVDQELSFTETGTPVGYLAHKGEDCDTRFYELTTANLLYKNADWEDQYLQVDGADPNSYQMLSQVEQENLWKQDEVFLLWDEEWESEMRYSKETTGYSVCSRELVEGLEARFGVVNYRPLDFESYDAYFSIRGYTDLKDALALDAPYGDWVGCILVKDDRFYYGNYGNQITGANLDALMEVLAGGF
jgi:hypothetical protein